MCCAWRAESRRDRRTAVSMRLRSGNCCIGGDRSRDPSVDSHTGRAVLKIRFWRTIRRVLVPKSADDPAGTASGPSGDGCHWNPNSSYRPDRSVAEVRFGRSPFLFTLARNWLPRRSVLPGQRSSAVPDHPDHQKHGRQHTLRSPGRA